MLHQSHSHIIKQNTQLIQKSGQRLANDRHTTQLTPLFSLPHLWRSALTLIVATVTTYGIGGVKCRQTGRRQRSVYLLELEPHFKCENKKSTTEESRGGDSESNDKLVPKKCEHSTHRVERFRGQPDNNEQRVILCKKCFGIMAAT